MKRIKKSKRNALVFMALLVCVFTALAFRTLADEIEATSSSTEIQAISSVESAARDTLESTAMGAENNPVLPDQSSAKQSTPVGISEVEPAAIVPFALTTGTNGTVDWEWDDVTKTLVLRPTDGVEGTMSPGRLYNTAPISENPKKIIFQGKIYANEDSSQLIYYNSELTEIDTSGLDTSRVVNMSEMFSGATGLTTLDVSHFDTSSVTNMYSMFDGSSNLVTLDVSNWDTQNVTDMAFMFSGCYNLAELDVSNFDTSKVTTMFYMFNGCSSLTELDVSGWNVENVTNMAAMFSSTSSLKKIDISNWNANSVQHLGFMFTGSGVEELDFSNFNTANVQNDSLGSAPGYALMAANCPNLKKLNISSFTPGIIGGGWSIPAEAGSSIMSGSPIIELTLGSDFEFYNFPGYFLPTPEGYSDGWFYLEDPTIRFDDETAFLTDYNATHRAGTYIRLGAEYTIQLDGNGGTLANGNTTVDIDTRYSQSSLDGVLPTELTNEFSREHYIFNGWNTQADGEGTSYKDGEKVKNLSKIQDDVVVLYAQWKGVEYTLHFDLNGSNTVPATIPSQGVEYPKAAIQPADPERRAFRFTGWYKDAANTVAWDFATDLVAGDTTIYAGWERTHWELHFDLDGGSSAAIPTDGIIIPINQSVDIAAYQPGAADAPVKKHNLFLGWTDQNGVVMQSSFIPTQDYVLKANWVNLDEIIQNDGEENIVIYKNESSVEDIVGKLDLKAGYTDLLGVYHTLDAYSSFNEEMIHEGGVEEIRFYVLDPATGEPIYSTNEHAYLYVLNRPYIRGNDHIWIFVGGSVSEEDFGIEAYGEMPNFAEKRIDRSAIPLVFNKDAINVWEVGTYYGAFYGNYGDYFNGLLDLNFRVSVRVMNPAGLTKEEQLQVDSSNFWVKVTTIYHQMTPGQVIEVNPSNYMDGGILTEEKIPEGANYDRLLKVNVGKYTIMNPDILDFIEAEKNGQMEVYLEGRTWIFNSGDFPSELERNVKGYYDLRMDYRENEEIKTLVGDQAQMGLHFNMNRSWSGTPLFMIQPNEMIQGAMAEGKTPYLFHYNESTEELELVGAMQNTGNGMLSIRMSGVYGEYVIVAGLPKEASYRITNETNTIDSKTYGEIAENLSESGRTLPSGSGLNGLSTVQYQTMTEGEISPIKTSESKSGGILPIGIVGGVTAAGIGYLLYKKRKNKNEE